MDSPDTLYETSLNSLNLRGRGKVRDIYDIDDQMMLIVTTDRISAFDVILPNPIPGKGIVLTSVSDFWFRKTESIIANHLTGLALREVLSDSDELAQVKGRGIVVKKLQPLPVEAIVRGYLIGSGWKDYLATGRVCGIELPSELKQAQKLPEAIYTPSTKADIGMHDENIAYEQSVSLLGQDIADRLRKVSLRLYREAAEYALQRGIIIADTKFEYGVDDQGAIYLIDEVLTPDSSRFWPADQYQMGTSPPSFDKQFIRDYLETLDWDKTDPGPSLPDYIVAKSAEKYRDAEHRLIRNFLPG